MITRTDAQLISEVRDRSDLGDSQFRTDAQIRRYINEKNRQLTSKLLALKGSDYFTTTDTIAVLSGTALYNLPDDCFKPKFFRVTINGIRINIPRAVTDELDLENDTAGWSGLEVVPKHRIRGKQVLFVPTPRASYTVTCHYIHTAIAIEGADDSAIDELLDNADYLNCYWGYEQWIVIAAAIMVKHDQEEDSSQLLLELAEIWNDISKVADDSTETEPEKIRDAYPSADIDDYY